MGKVRPRATDGTLSAHPRKLADAGHAAVDKSFIDRGPRAAPILTDEDRKAFTAHLDGIGDLVESRALPDRDGHPRRPSLHSPPGRPYLSSADRVQRSPSSEITSSSRQRPLVFSK